LFESLEAKRNVYLSTSQIKNVGAYRLKDYTIKKGAKNLIQLLKILITAYSGKNERSVLGPFLKGCILEAPN